MSGAPHEGRHGEYIAKHLQAAAEATGRASAAVPADQQPTDRVDVDEGLEEDRE